MNRSIDINIYFICQTDENTEINRLYWKHCFSPNY